MSPPKQLCYYRSCYFDIITEHIVVQKHYLINDKITATELRVIDGEGENRGVMTTAAAIQLAEESGVDLVVISEKANPPVARLLDFRYFLRQQREQELKSRRKSKQDLKQLRLGPNIDEHDLLVRIRRAQGFLEDGDKVKFIVQFKGRMIANQAVGREKLERIKQELEEVVTVEKDIWVEGRNMMLIVRPK